MELLGSLISITFTIAILDKKRNALSFKSSVSGKELHFCIHLYASKKVRPRFIFRNSSCHFCNGLIVERSKFYYVAARVVQECSARTRKANYILVPFKKRRGVRIAEENERKSRKKKTERVTRIKRVCEQTLRFTEKTLET